MRIFKQQNLLRACASARVVCGAGYAVRLVFPSLPKRGERSAEKRGGVRSLLSGRRAARHSLFEACPLRLRDGEAPLGAPQAAISVPGSAFPGTRHFKPVPVQRAPRGGVLMPPDRLPRPPGSGVTSPARRRRIRLHPRNVSRRRPSMSRTLVGLHTCLLYTSDAAD